MRIFEWLVEFWDRLRGFLGFHRFTRKGRGDDLFDAGFLRRLFYFARPVILLFVIVYFGVMIWRFSFIRGEDLGYPQAVFANPPIAVAEASCEPSRIVYIEEALLDFVVNQNDWVPATPQYRAGFFWLVDWRDTPWFDNKASFQTGVLEAVRRVSVELTDTIGRVRGTSAADPDLVAARGRLQIDESTWVINVTDDRLPLYATSAASNYADAIGLMARFNERLASCEALFDARADNLRQFLDRIANDLGSVVDKIGKRSQGRIYDVETHQFVDGEGNNRGWFDVHADNLFHEARGRMYAYHGILQGARIDFAEVIEQRNLKDVWDRMEARVAETAALAPWIVSNGRQDGFLMPDHLSVMAEGVLRARANMVELRDILIN